MKTTRERLRELLEAERPYKRRRMEFFRKMSEARYKQHQALRKPKPVEHDFDEDHHREAMRRILTEGMSDPYQDSLDEFQKAIEEGEWYKSDNAKSCALAYEDFLNDFGDD